MLPFLLVLAGLSLAVWTYLRCWHGGFWRADQHLAVGEALEKWPRIVVVVPARNEADVIAQTIGSLLVQEYPHAFPIVLVDDGSDDGTAMAARTSGAGSRLDVVAGKPVPEGWVGKVWAMAQGVDRAAEIAPEARYILFCDADIVHEAGNLRRLVNRAEVAGTDLVSVMVKLAAHGFWERLLIPAFVFFFQMLYPFAQVNRGRRYAAAGGCMLVRWRTLDEAGGMARIRNALIDDCALARLIGRQGGALWLGLSSETRSTRPYGGFTGVWNMVARSAFTQLNYSAANLLGTVLAMILTYLVPPLALFGFWLAGDPVAALVGGAAYALMVATYWPTVRFYEQPFASALLLPLVAVLYTGMTIDSALRHWRGTGGGWKGRVYSRRNGSSSDDPATWV